MKKNVILADCDKEELKDLIKGLQISMNREIYIENCICNEDHGKILNIKRYLLYALYPIKFIFRHKQYEYVIGWQQFYALFFMFYCKLFHLKNMPKVIVCNFTYKEKKGLAGIIYLKLMKYCVSSSHLDYIHVPSYQVAKKYADDFLISIDKFVCVPFGLPDTSKQWKGSKVKEKDYIFSIGRSNRDFDFLVTAWRRMPDDQLLIIASDSYKPKNSLPSNVIHRKDIVGDRQFPYIMNCKAMIIPIKDSMICSGDTVLMKAMSFEKPLIITIPSTLAEMYVVNGYNGLTVEKNPDYFVKLLCDLLHDEKKMKILGKNARESYLKNYSRFSMGEKIGESVLGKKT